MGRPFGGFGLFSIAIIGLVIGRREAGTKTARRRHAPTSATAHDLTAVLGPDQRGC